MCSLSPPTGQSTTTHSLSKKFTLQFLNLLNYTKLSYSPPPQEFLKHFLLLLIYYYILSCTIVICEQILCLLIDIGYVKGQVYILPILYLIIIIFIVILLQSSQFFTLCSPPPSPPPAPTVNPHTVVHVHGSFIHVLCLVLPLPSTIIPLPSGHCQSVPGLHACGSILLVSLSYSLDSSYRWDHMVFVFRNLAYFT